MAGTTVMVPLEKPYPFGIAHVLNTGENGDLLLQWMGNAHDSVYGVYHKGWKTETDKTYYASTPRKLEDVPYTTGHDKITLNQRDILMHDFELTPSDKLPRVLLRVIAEHPNVWWDPKTPKDNDKEPEPPQDTTDTENYTAQNPEPDSRENPQDNIEPEPTHDTTNTDDHTAQSPELDSEESSQDGDEHHDTEPDSEDGTTSADEEKQANIHQTGEENNNARQKRGTRNRQTTTKYQAYLETKRH